MARIITFSDPKPDVPLIGSITTAAFAGKHPIPEDPMLATERMWWRATGRLAYPEGATFSAAELPLLVSNAEHEANMRAGVADKDAAVQHPAVELEPIQTEPLVPVETRLITSAPERRFEVQEGERRRPGRPPRPRMPDGSIVRD